MRSSAYPLLSLRRRGPLLLGRHVSRRPRLGRAPGFTLVELMVVVVIIAVLAVLAVPNITRRLQDRKVSETAERIAAIYRGSRARAMARGGAVLVRFTKATGTITVLEAVNGDPSRPECAALPASSCMLTPWDNAALGQALQTESLVPSIIRSDLLVTMTTPQNASPSVYDVCFTPLGRSLHRNGPGTQFSTMNGAPELRVLRGTTAAPLGLVRTVTVLPTGQARLGTAVAQ